MYFIGRTTVLTDMSEELLLAQAAILLQGGFDTTAVTLTFAIYELAYHPEIQV